ncbi:dTDP-4-dehydrorhamnose reductase [candidate division WOR-1 bacterium RIFCSPLOWO2_02_FULL_46_20]|uniref:dTDP-4-dehydrorhamnose reductase n=2 Tax=Saganbacteria TaxID=1703751 RepID=A0A1F4R6V2_UNCSA|nr:MAG: dTDP-4-dehydrorhamnose reductase [candidate division WOR-1 bacterium RIFCSPHIGHO2_02_FULL_45_12]OGC03908.1 MAG: dTDP-4-dehydrorhamnose reductase [candidate division WOR-1 bacterium RIFCSPLOWO2_02_FULL_46_20]OGC09308.1 MAG: dTDP-4-dehydrorhamnose reductase [candidate division WOR-1 bacterium RIFCSPLOWO2_12_FULL_45_9]
MKIAIIGADGQLGTDLSKVIAKDEQIPLTINDIDITNKEKTFAVLKKHAPDVVINTSAYHQVDKCEEELQPAFAVNTFGVKYLARACREIGSTLVHISTDYVFDGGKDRPYLETDMPNPQSVYAISKLAGEQCVKYVLDKYFIVRSSGLYGEAGCLGKGGGNFVEGMLKRATSQSEIKVVTDEVLAPTYTLDLANKIYELIRTRHYGLYHIVNHGQCSWHEFAVKIFELLGRHITIHKITAKEFITIARRPKYSVLKNEGLARLKMDNLRSWQDALKAYLVEKGYLR